MAHTTSVALRNIDAVRNRITFGKGYPVVYVNDTAGNRLWEFEEEGASPEAAAGALVDFLQEHDAGRFVIDAREKAGPAGTKTGIKFVFEMAAANINGPVQFAGNQSTGGDWMRLYYEQLLENALLRKEIESKNSAAVGSPMFEALAQAAQPVLIGLAQKFLGLEAAPAMAGPGRQAQAVELSPAEEAELQDRYAMAMNTILEVDPDFITKLEKVANFAKSNPEKFKSGFSTILNML